MNNKTIIIGIAGPSASGKSLLANTIVDELGSDEVAVISEDSYYNDLGTMPVEERAHVNFDHPTALDHDLLTTHLDMLKQGKSIEVPCYDHTTHQRKSETRTIANHHIIVLEGILAFVEEPLRELMDIKIFMDTALDICLLRRLNRDLVERNRTLDSILKQYHATVRPMYFQFIEPSKRYADIIVPRGGENRIAIEMIKAKMREMLSSANQ